MLFKLNILFILIFYYWNIFPQQSSLSRGVNILSSFIASEEFSELKKIKNDIELVDIIYEKGLEYYNGDISETLSALTFTTIPYRIVPIKIPFINLILNYPLVSADIDTYNKKNENLPRYLYFDSPQTKSGDIDKLAHFFGNAFFSFSIKIFNFSESLGILVEMFEETFKVQSKIDERDLITNKLGIMFGKALKENKNVKPSGVILSQTLKLIRFSP